MVVRAGSRISNWTGLPVLLHHESPRPHVSTAYKLADLDLDDVASSQLAVDGEVEQSPVADPLFTVEQEANGPDLLRLQRSLGANQFTCVPSPCGSRRDRTQIVP